MGIKGVQFLSDSRGRKTRVLIDLRRHRRIWEDIYDELIAETRKNEPRMAWEDARKRMRAKRARRG